MVIENQSDVFLHLLRLRYKQVSDKSIQEIDSVLKFKVKIGSSSYKHGSYSQEGDK